MLERPLLREIFRPLVAGDVSAAAAIDVPFDPVDALGADLLAYWDASDAALITQAGGLVSSWKDRVNAYDAAQATGAAQPAFSSAGGPNAGPELVFDGVDDCLAMASQPFPAAATPSEIWFLGRQAAPASDVTTRTAFIYGGTTQTSRLIRRQVTASVNRLAAAAGDGSATVAPVSSIDFTGVHVARGQFDATAARVTGDATSVVSLPVVPATGAVRARIGAFVSSSPSNFWQGGVSVVAVTAPLSADKAAAFYRFLSAWKG